MDERTRTVRHSQQAPVDWTAFLLTNSAEGVISMAVDRKLKERDLVAPPRMRMQSRVPRLRTSVSPSAVL